jgi:hypothetical protein
MPTFDELQVAIMSPVEETVRADETAVRQMAPSAPAGSLDQEVVQAAPDEPAPEPDVVAAPRPKREPAAGGGAPSPPSSGGPAEAPAEVSAPPIRLPEPEARDEDPWEEAQPEPESRVNPPSRPPPPGELPERRVVVIDEDPDINIEAGREEPPPPPGSREPEEPGMAEIGATLDDEKGRKRRWRIFRKGGDR